MNKLKKIKIKKISEIEPKMRLKYIKRLTALLLAFPLFLALFNIIQANRNRNIRAYGDLVVDFGVPAEGPIFVLDDFMPGDCEDHDITVTNGGLNTALVTIKSDNEIDIGNLSDILSIVINEISTDLYGGSSPTGPKTLADFYLDSDNPDGIPLSNIAGESLTTYNIQVCFPWEAGNEFQKTSTVFDLVFGELLPPIDLPEECWHLRGTITEVVEGTEGNDRIHATTADELILLYGGNDKVWASSGDDCIVAGPGNDHVYEGTGDGVVLGGPGNDKIDTGAGNDSVYGGEGNDKIETGSGEDYVEGGPGNDNIKSGSGDDVVFGNEGNDVIRSGSDDDLVYGNEGNDVIRSGSGNDMVYGGSGNDVLRGGSGNDWLYGEEGDDVLRGQTGNDYLDGGDGIDVLKGNFGTDTCIFGETYSSCEFY